MMIILVMSQRISGLDCDFSLLQLPTPFTFSITIPVKINNSVLIIFFPIASILDTFGPRFGILCSIIWAMSNLKFIVLFSFKIPFSNTSPVLPSRFYVHHSGNCPSQIVKSSHSLQCQLKLFLASCTSLCCNF